jgi:hypothetical protein
MISYFGVGAFPPFRHRPTDEDLSVGALEKKRKDGARRSFKNERSETYYIEIKPKANGR